MCKMNSNCFLCLANCHPGTNSGKINNDLLTYSNYIKMSIPNDIDEQSEVNNLIKVCLRCQQILKTFVELLKALEIAQIKLDFCVGQIRDLILEGEKTENPGNKGVTITRNLRIELIEKTLRKLQSSRNEPTVNIVESGTMMTRTCDDLTPAQTQPYQEIVNVDSIPEEEDETELPLDLDEDSLTAGSDSIPQVDPLNEEGESFIVRKEITNSKGIRMMHPYCLKCGVFVKKLSKHLLFLHKIKLNHKRDDSFDPDKKISCPYCRAEFKEKILIRNKNVDFRYGENMLRRHLLNYHSEHFFPTLKLDFVSDPDFRKICAELLFKGLLDGKSACAFCERTFMNPTGGTRRKHHNETQMKLHLVEEHFDKLEERLEDIQRDPSLQKILYECNPIGKICECGVYISVDRSRVHSKFHCVLIPSDKLVVIPRGKRKSSKLPTTKTDAVVDPEKTKKDLSVQCAKLNENSKPKPPLKTYGRCLPKKLPVSETDDPRKVKGADVDDLSLKLKPPLKTYGRSVRKNLPVTAIATGDPNSKNVKDTHVNHSKPNPMDTEETSTPTPAALVSNGTEYEYFGDMDMDIHMEEEAEEEEPILEIKEEELSLDDLLA